MHCIELVSSVAFKLPTYSLICYLIFKVIGVKYVIKYLDANSNTFVYTKHRSLCFQRVYGNQCLLKESPTECVVNK